MYYWWCFSQILHNFTLFWTFPQFVAPGFCRPVKPLPVKTMLLTCWPSYSPQQLFLCSATYFSSLFGFCQIQKALIPFYRILFVYLHFHSNSNIFGIWNLLKTERITVIHCAGYSGTISYCIFSCIVICKNWTEHKTLRPVNCLRTAMQVNYFRHA